MLREEPSGNLFGLTQNVGMGWQPDALSGPQVVIVSRVRLEELNWLADPLAPGDECRVQVRHRAPGVAATVAAMEPGAVDLILSTPVRAITPGQSGVLYSAEDRVLGGGVIG
jgi:tRNA U34 2-thiouridine synthase MnmA/TrmU